MKLYKKVFGLFLFSFATFFCVSCNVDWKIIPETGDDPDQPSTVEEKTELFEESTTDTYIFETNDTKYLSENGYTFWTTNYENTSSSFEPVTVSLYKESGNYKAGYGVVFCTVTNDTSVSLYTVMITTKGFYTIGKVSNGEFSKITDWASCKYLKTGYGVSNKLSVTYDEENKAFNIYINGILTKTFLPDGNLTFSGTKSGYVVVISGSEKFPSESLKVVFKKESN